MHDVTFLAALIAGLCASSGGAGCDDERLDHEYSPSGTTFREAVLRFAAIET